MNKVPAGQLRRKAGVQQFKRLYDFFYCIVSKCRDVHENVQEKCCCCSKLFNFYLLSPLREAAEWEYRDIYLWCRQFYFCCVGIWQTPCNIRQQILFIKQFEPLSASPTFIHWTMWMCDFNSGLVSSRFQAVQIFSGCLTTGCGVMCSLLVCFAGTWLPVLLLTEAGDFQAVSSFHAALLCG